MHFRLWVMPLRGQSMTLFIEKEANAVKGEPTGNLARRAVQWLLHRFEGEWKELAQAKEGTWRYKVHQRALSGLDRIDPWEHALKEVPSRVGHGERTVELVHPESDASAEIVERLMRTLDTTQSIHRRRLVLWACAVPFTASLSILPGPNVFVAWNIYRLYTLQSALRGSKRLSGILAGTDSEHPLKLISDSRLDNLPALSVDQVQQMIGDGAATQLRRARMHLERK